jgi:hypothetical protein
VLAGNVACWPVAEEQFKVSPPPLHGIQTFLVLVLILSHYFRVEFTDQNLLLTTRLDRVSVVDGNKSLPKSLLRCSVVIRTGGFTYPLTLVAVVLDGVSRAPWLLKMLPLPRFLAFMVCPPLCPSAFTGLDCDSCNLRTSAGSKFFRSTGACFASQFPTLRRRQGLHTRLPTQLA